MVKTKSDPLQGLVLALFDGVAPPLHWAVEWGAHGDPVTEAWMQSTDAASMAMVLLYTTSVGDAVARIARSFRALLFQKSALYLSDWDKDLLHNIDLLSFRGPTGQYCRGRSRVRSDHPRRAVWDATFKLFEARSSWIDSAAISIGQAVELFTLVYPESELREALRLEGAPVFEDVIAALGTATK